MTSFNSSDPLGYLGINPKEQPQTIIADRAPTTQDNSQSLGTRWLNTATNIIYDKVADGTWTANNLTLSTDGTFAGALDTTASSSLAIKTYADALAIAGAPVATTGTSGIGRLVSDANAVAEIPSTGAQAYFLQPSNLTAIFAEAPAIGGTTPAAATFTDLTTSGTVNIIGDAAMLIDVAGAGIDVTLSSDAGRVIIQGDEATANAVTIASSAGGLDLDVALGLDLVCTEAAADAIILSATAGGIDITAAGAGLDLDMVSSGGSVNITASESAQDSIVITSTAGGIDILASGAAAGEDIDIVATGSSVNISSSENAADAITVTASAGGIDITNTGTAGEDIDIASTGASVNISSTEDAALALYLHADGGVSETIDIHSDQGTGVASINVHSDVGGVTLASGLASADAININASNAAGGIDIDCGSAGFIVDAAAGAISLDSALASNFTVTGAADLSLISTAGSIIVNAEEAVADAIQLTSAAGGLSASVALQMSLVSTQAAANAIVIDASNAAGGIDVDCGSGGFALDAAAGAISLDSALASNFTVTGAADLTLSSSAGSVIVSASESAVDALQLLSTAGGIDILASGAAAGEDIDIIATGSSVNITSTEADAAAIVLNASNAAGGIDISTGGGSVDVSSAGFVTMVPGTSTAAAATGTVNTNYGVTTHTGLTTASAASQVFTITNSLCTAGSAIFVSASNLGANDAQMTITRVTPGAGSFTVTLTNNGAAALNGDVILTWWIAAV